MAAVAACGQLFSVEPLILLSIAHQSASLALASLKDATRRNSTANNRLVVAHLTIQNGGMRRNALLSFAVVFLASCATETWIPVNGYVGRAAVAKGHVVFLASPPQRPYTVIGIITPEAGEYETEAEAVDGMRKEAAKYGVDAIFVESQSPAGGWHFGSGWSGTSDASFSEVRLRGNAIIWSGSATRTGSRSQVPVPSPKPPRTPKTEPVATINSPVTPTLNYPTAKPVPGKPGYVYSIDPKGGMIDVTGYNSGDKAKDPYSNEIFIVP